MTNGSELKRTLKRKRERKKGEKEKKKKEKENPILKRNGESQPKTKTVQGEENEVKTKNEKVR